MKPIISSLLLGACVIASGVDGRTKQTTTSSQNSDQVGVIHSVEADGSLKSLEECAGQFHSSGSGGVTIAFLACRNPKSSVRLKAGTPFEFQVRLHKDNLNKKYSLYAVATKGDLRAFYVAAPPRGAAPYTDHCHPDWRVVENYDGAATSGWRVHLCDVHTDDGDKDHYSSGRIPLRNRSVSVMGVPAHSVRKEQSWQVQPITMLSMHLPAISTR